MTQKPTLMTPLRLDTPWGPALALVLAILCGVAAIVLRPTQLYAYPQEVLDPSAETPPEPSSSQSPRLLIESLQQSLGLLEVRDWKERRDVGYAELLPIPFEDIAQFVERGQAHMELHFLEVSIDAVGDDDWIPNCRVQAKPIDVPVTQQTLSWSRALRESFKKFTDIPGVTLQSLVVGLEETGPSVTAALILDDIESYAELLRGADQLGPMVCLKVRNEADRRKRRPVRREARVRSGNRTPILEEGSRITVSISLGLPEQSQVLATPLHQLLEVASQFETVQLKGISVWSDQKRNPSIGISVSCSAKSFREVASLGKELRQQIQTLHVTGTTYEQDKQELSFALTSPK